MNEKQQNQNNVFSIFTTAETTEIRASFVFILVSILIWKHKHS